MAVSSTSASATASATASSNMTLASNRTLIITLSSVFSVVGVLLIIAIVFACWRYHRRGSLFPRVISPIDDDEIETWKVDRVPEKGNISVGVSADHGHRRTQSASRPTSSTSWNLHVRDLSTAESRHSDNLHHVHDVLDAQDDAAYPAARARGGSLDSILVSKSSPKSPKRSPSKVIIDQEPSFYNPAGSPGSRGSRGSRGSNNYHSPYVFDAPAATAAGAAAVESWQQWQQHSPQRRSEEAYLPRTVRSSRSLSLGQHARGPLAGRFSFDQERGRDVPLSELSPRGQTLVQLDHDSTLLPADVHARAPNSRIGLTDETIPGDPSFFPSPRPLRRQISRLSKAPPVSSANGTAPRRGSAHGHKSSLSAGSISGVSGIAGVAGSSTSWHAHTAHTRNARSNSTISSRSLMADSTLHSQRLDEEHLPPLPFPFSSPMQQQSHFSQSSLPFRQRSASDLAHPNTANEQGGSISSPSRAYLRQHNRFYSSSSIPPQLTLRNDNDIDGKGTLLGSQSPRSWLHDQNSIGQAIG